MQLDHGGLRRRGRPLNKDLFKLNLRDLIELGHAIDGTFAPETRRLRAFKAGFLGFLSAGSLKAGKAREIFSSNQLGCHFAGRVCEQSSPGAERIILENLDGHDGTRVLKIGCSRPH